jgi:signal transduction histidine kinase
MGRPAAEFVNHTIQEVIPNLEPDWVARLCRVAITGEPERFDRFGFGLKRDYEVSVYSPQRGQFVMLLHDITEQKEAEDKLRQSMVELHAVSTRLNEIREQERARMARDIHDHLGQSLTALKMDVAEVRRRLKAADADAVEERLTEMSVLIDESVNDIRRVAAELRPPILDGLGVVAAIRAYLQDFSRRVNVPCVLTTDLFEVTLADDRAIALFRILQEALTNVVRHAAAGRIDVALRADSAMVHLTVHDDGRGIPAEETRDPRALGLVGMRDRARLFGGDVAVSGRPGKGTTVTAFVPLAETTV